MKHARELFEIKRADRTIQIWRLRRGHRKWYFGAINGELCAFGDAKGELLRRLIDMARNYPPTPRPLRVAHPRKAG